MGNLTDKVAVISGGSKGIGAGIALALAREGVDCVLAARDEAVLAATAAAISGETGRKIDTVAADLNTLEGCESVHAAVAAGIGRVDILVNNAGSTKSGPFLGLADEDWVDGMMLKFHGAVRLSRLLWPMLKESHGTVINVIGGAARTPRPDAMIGTSVNSAMAAFTKALAGQGLADDVNVNAIHPGLTRTERFHTLMQARADTAGVPKEEFGQNIMKRQGIRRLGEVEDVANLAVFLCRPEARHINGTAIAVDGGGTPGLY
ncbi:MAG: SDR family NAD(P)-dependent oxidoreductase [Acidimicrobiia bacterium]